MKLFKCCLFDTGLPTSSQLAPAGNIDAAMCLTVMCAPVSMDVRPDDMTRCPSSLGAPPVLGLRARSLAISEGRTCLRCAARTREPSSLPRPNHWPAVKVSRGTAAHVVRWEALHRAPNPRAQRGVGTEKGGISKTHKLLAISTTANGPLASDQCTVHTSRGRHNTRHTRHRANMMRLTLFPPQPTARAVILNTAALPKTHTKPEGQKCTSLRKKGTT